MHIHILAVGQKMPAWVYTACEEYTRRMPREIDLQVKEIAMAKRGKHPDVDRLRREEAESLKAAMPAGAMLVALDVTGKRQSTEQLSRSLDSWMQNGRDVCIAIGGPDGFDAGFLATADTRISLSDMTFPHPLVRVIIVEQLYRAWSILQNHPYHRG